MIGQSKAQVGVWAHVVGTYDKDAGTMTLYLNGVSQGTAVAPQPFALSSGTFVIGRGKYNTPGGHFNGSVDNVQAFQHALTDAEAAALYNGGRAGGALAQNPAIVRSTTPTMYASISDPDQGQQLYYEFEIRSQNAADNAPQVVSSGWLGPVISPANVTWTVPPGKLADGGGYYWRVRAKDADGDNPMVGLWSPWQVVIIDTTTPALATVTSPQYPLHQWGATVGTPGTFTLSNTSSDTYAFEWWVDNGAHTVTAATVSGPPTATVSYTPTKDLTHVLQVMARDRAGNVGGVYQHTFQVKSLPKRCWNWRLDETSGTTAADSGNTDTNDTICAPIDATVTPMPGTVSANTNGSTQWVVGHVNGALAFNGAGGQVTTSGPVVDTTKSFTVMAWVRLDATGANGHRAAIAQDGANISGFYLQYAQDANGGAGGWCFAMTTADSTSASSSRACTTQPVATGEWVHLAGVRDTAAGAIRVYVMGDPDSCGGEVAEAAYTGSWSAGGALTIGRARWNTSAVDHWPGAIDDVYMFPKVLTAADICLQAIK